MFEVRVRNNRDKAQKVTLGLSFPGPRKRKRKFPQPAPENYAISGGCRFPKRLTPACVSASRSKLNEGTFHGQLVSSPVGTEYAVGVIGDTPTRFGGAMWIYGYEFLTGQNWIKWRGKCPIKLPPTSVRPRHRFRDRRRRRENRTPSRDLVFANLEGRQNKSYARMYAREYKGAAHVAKFVADNHESLLQRIVSWQQAVYNAEEYPVWLRESLVNIFHLTPKTGFWAVAQNPIGDWCREEDGLFGMSECPRECPQIECIPCSFYGNVPLVYFFPDLALSTLRGYKAYQYSDGAPPWSN